MSGKSASRTLRWPLGIRESQTDGIVVFELSGRIGYTAAGELTAALAAAIDKGARNLILDFEAVDYISGAGLQAIDRALTHLAAVDGIAVLCSLTEPIRLTFDLAGSLTRYHVEASRDRAVCQIRARSDC